MEEVWGEKDIQNEVREFYDKLIEKIDEFIDAQRCGIDVLGSDKLEERVDEIKNDLIQCIVQIVRNEDKKFDFGRVEELCGDNDFWEDIKGETERRTRDYLRAGSLRRFDDDFRRKCFKTAFDMSYFEGEIPEYVSEILNIDKEDGFLLYQVLGFSESFIIERSYSKRIFGNNIQKKYGFSAEDSDMIWGLFQSNKEKIEKTILRRRLTNIDYKISRISERVGNLEEVLDLVLDIFLDMAEEDS